MFSRQILRTNTSFFLAKKSKIKKFGKNFTRNYSVTGDVVSPPLVSGIENLISGRINKGMAFTLNERQVKIKKNGKTHLGIWLID